jgi:hypothetical protein
MQNHPRPTKLSQLSLSRAHAVFDRVVGSRCVSYRQVIIASLAPPTPAVES